MSASAEGIDEMQMAENLQTYTSPIPSFAWWFGGAILCLLVAGFFVLCGCLFCRSEKEDSSYDYYQTYPQQGPREYAIAGYAQPQGYTNI